MKKINLIIWIIGYLFLGNHVHLFAQVANDEVRYIQLSNSFGSSFLSNGSGQMLGSCYGVSVLVPLNHYLFFETGVNKGVLKGNLPNNGYYNNSYTNYDSKIGYNHTINSKYKLLNGSNYTLGFGASILSSLVQSNINPDYNIFNWTFFNYVISAKYQYKINNSVFIHLGLNYQLSTSKYIDGLSTGGNDRFIQLQAGLTYNLFQSGYANQNSVKSDDFDKVKNEFLEKLNEVNAKFDSAISANSNALNSLSNSIINIPNAIKKQDSLNFNYENTKLEPVDSSLSNVYSPVYKYNLVFGGFMSLKNAAAEMKRLKSLGINVKLYWKGGNSKLIFIVLFSSNDISIVQSKAKTYSRKGLQNLWIYVKK